MGTSRFFTCRAQTGPGLGSFKSSPEPQLVSLNSGLFSLDATGVRDPARTFTTSVKELRELERGLQQDATAATSQFVIFLDQLTAVQRLC